MKKTFMALLVVFAIATIASAQTEPPPPPKKPKPPVEKLNDVPPPPPPPNQPPPPPPPPPHELTKEQIAQLPSDYQDFLKRNPSVSSVHWQDGAIFIVPKNGKAERYNLDEQGIKKAEAKYGKLPTIPPPPQPPTPPQPPKI